jgi:uncharacterized protein (DUF1697 family)
MSTLISMLRGINVGAQKIIRMETLRAIYEGLGFSNVRTYVQSGNVLFESTESDHTNLVKRIEAQIEKTCGYHVSVFIRQPHNLQRILEGSPFLHGRNEDPRWLHVTFLYQPPPDNAWSKLKRPVNIADEFASGELAIYLFCPNGYGKTKLNNSFFEKKLGVPVTTRNWNTVNALYKMVMEE